MKIEFIGEYKPIQYWKVSYSINDSEAQKQMKTLGFSDYLPNQKIRVDDTLMIEFNSYWNAPTKINFNRYVLFDGKKKQLNYFFTKIPPSKAIN